MKQSIVINARFLTQPISGVQRFGIEISKELKKSDVRFEFFAPKNILHKKLAKELGVKIIGTGLLKGHLWEQIILPFYILRKRALLVSFCNTAPVLLKNQIVTIHDLAFMVNPNWFSKKFSKVYNILIPLIAKKSKHILTVSEVSKKEIIHKLKVPPTKITVAYNAISSIFLNKTNHKEKLTEDYILTVSSHNPRKNFKNLIDAFYLMPESKLKLYVIGNFNRNFNNTDLNILKNSRIKFLENVTDQALLKYYQNAKLFVYPSLYEGFGIPIIEAMSQNIPICVSDIDVFHEVCGNNCLYFDPFDIEDIKTKMIECLKKNNDCNYHLEKYNWEFSAKKIKNIIFTHN